jgi:hypothetical protein
LPLFTEKILVIYTSPLLGINRQKTLRFQGWCRHAPVERLRAITGLLFDLYQLRTDIAGGWIAVSPAPTFRVRIVPPACFKIREIGIPGEDQAMSPARCHLKNAVRMK